MLPTKLDDKGESFEFCPDHFPDAPNAIEAFSYCELEDNPSCHPDRMACPYLVELTLNGAAEVHAGNYVKMIFPSHSGRPADEGHPGGEDLRVYRQEYVNGAAVGVPEPLWKDEPLSGYRNECTSCEDDCDLCSWEVDCFSHECIVYDDDYWGQDEEDHNAT